MIKQTEGLQNIVKEKPGINLAHMSLAKLYMVQKNMRMRFWNFKTVLESSPQRMIYLPDAGFAYFEQKKFNEAAAEFKLFLDNREK